MIIDPIDIITVGACLVELTPGEAGLTIAEAPVLQKLATGAAALLACGVSKLGCRSALLSAVGDDELGEFVIAEMKRMGVDVSLILRVPEQLTTVSFASADGHGGKTFRFYRFPGRSDPLETLDSRGIPDSTLGAARLFDFTESSIRSGGRLRESVFDLATRSRKLGLEVCYAPNWRPGLWSSVAEGKRVQLEAARLADILLLNSEEAELISGRPDPDDAAAWLADRGPHTVVVTAGGDRPAVVRSAGGIGRVPPFPVAMLYDVGAGDTFHAAFLAGRLHELDASDGADTQGPDSASRAVRAARFAAAAAAIKITRPPGFEGLPTRSEVEALLHSTNLARPTTLPPG